MRAYFLAASAALLVSTMAFADDTKPATPTPVTTDSSSDKPICQPVTHEGTVVGQTCRTQKEWDQMRFRQQQQLRQYQSQSLYQPGPH